MRFSFAIILAAVCAIGAHSSHIVSLNSIDAGAEWELFRQLDELGTTGNIISIPGFVPKDAVAGVVPGTTFAAYVAAGREDNPEWGDNIYLTDETWYNTPFWYRTEFATPEHKEDERVWLHFDSTHRYADFFVNGTKVSGTSTSSRDVKGHILRSRFDITDLLKSDGLNAVAVRITDPDQRKTRVKTNDFDSYVNCSSPSYMAAAGWDWMPYIPGRLAGITGNVYLRVTGSAVIRDPWVRGLLDEAGNGDVRVKATLKNVGASRSEVTLRGTITPGDFKFEKTVSVEADGEAEVSMDKTDCAALGITNPRLWWPNGYGEPNLYTCKLEAVLGGQVTDTQTFNFGVRKYEWKRVDNSSGQSVLQLYVNGKRVYVKGGNWGISEYLLRCHGEEYETKIRLHHDMNYNMIRLWTGCVTDEEFYDYCDRYGIMVWDDFWLMSAFIFDVAEYDTFKVNALEKVRRLRNHACIALWCGANESYPNETLDPYLKQLIADEDAGDRMYKSCSNDDGISGSGWWMAQTPDRYFESASNAMSFNGFPFTDTSGYGFRSEIGMCCFPNYESMEMFMPEESRWPLPDDETLKNVDNTVWNHHFFGKEAQAAAPEDYKRMVANQYGESQNLQEFCEKAQLLNMESMKGMYEAWNDKMWNDASGFLLWMSNPAYPVVIWQTYDYYYDTPGSYWGAKYGCEHRHIQWNSRTGSVKVVNTTSEELKDVTAEARVFDSAGREIESSAQSTTLTLEASDRKEAFVLNVRGDAFPGLRFVRLRLLAADGTELSRNLYWHNCSSKYYYKGLASLPEAEVACDVTPDAAKGAGHYILTLENRSDAVAMANRIRLVNPVSGERILPVIMSDNFVTLMPRESRTIAVEAPVAQLADGADVMVKQFRKPEFKAASTVGAGVDVPVAGSGNGIACYAPGNGELTIGWNDGTDRMVTVFNAQGCVVVSRVMQSMETMQMSSAGIYIVNAGGETVKIAVK